MKRVIFIFLLIPELCYSQRFNKFDLDGYWEKVWYISGGYTAFYGSGALNGGFYFDNGMVRFLDNIYYSGLLCKYSNESNEFREKAQANYVNSTSYFLSDSLLKIKMPYNDEWIELKIKKFDSDTLKIKNIDLNYEEWFVKKHYENVPGININKIIYSTGYCFGTCPVFNIEIDSDRTAIYEVIEYVKLIGKYNFIIDNKSYKLLCDYLKMANLRNCKSSYSRGMTDLETKETTILYNNTEKKHIEDYGEGGPVELLWFYNEICNIVKRFSQEK